jgi:DNA polymerase III alpha subunit
MSNIDYEDEKTWDLFKDGKTKGIFQLESNLGRSWSKKLQPENIEELAALIALIRPGCLKAVIDGKSMTQRFVDRKHNNEEVTYLHDGLEDILKPTYGVLVYQEQSMRIAQKLAGFDLKKADDLRKAIGKKKAGLMAEIKEDFIEGCQGVGVVNLETATEIFSWIEKSSRYSFNKSHAVAYAVDSYWSAWYKANHVKEFFLSYLYYSGEKQDPHQEVYELVNEAKLFNIEVKIPKLSSFSEKFRITEDGIYFGIKDIKGLTGVTGEKAVNAISEAKEELGKNPSEFTWMDVLLKLSSKINLTAFKALASIGFFSTKSTGVNRNKALYEYLIFRELTKVELGWVQKHYPQKRWSTLKDCFTDLAPTKKLGGGTSNVNRSQIVRNEVDMLESPPYDLSDDPAWIIEQENKFLGCPVSLSKVESSDTSSANTFCKDVLNGKTGKNICIAANLNRVNNHKVKKGKTKGKLMSFLTIEDTTCSLDSVVIFPEAREKYQYVLYEGNNLLLCGEIGADGSFIVNKVHEI